MRGGVRACVRAGGLACGPGAGEDGRIAQNEPGSSLVSRTRVKTLAQQTILANARYFENDMARVPKLVLTIGIGTFMAAREVVLMITGGVAPPLPRGAPWTRATAL